MPAAGALVTSIARAPGVVMVAPEFRLICLGNVHRGRWAGYAVIQTERMVSAVFGRASQLAIVIPAMQALKLECRLVYVGNVHRAQLGDCAVTQMESLASVVFGRPSRRASVTPVSMNSP